MVLADGSVYPHRGTGYPGRPRDRSAHRHDHGEGRCSRTPSQLLRPGQYARVRVETDVARGALVVPQRALQDLQGLAQLAVVGADDKVEVRTVKKGASWGTLQVVTKGVAAGERVIVEGFQKVRPGMMVAPKPAPAELAGAPPDAAPARLDRPAEPPAPAGAPADAE